MYYGEAIRKSLGLALGSFLVFMLAGSLGWTGFQVGGHDSHRRHCFANQKTLMGCIEMYQLDFNTRVETFDRAFLERLRDEGYLMTIPDDPGVGEGSWRNYYLYRDVEASARDPWGSWQVMCLRHGFLVPPAGTTHADGGLDQLAFLDVDPGRAPLDPPLGWLDCGDSGSQVQSLFVLVMIGSGLVLPLAVGAFLLALLFEFAAWISRGPPAREAAQPREGEGSAPVDLAAAKCPVCADGFGAGTPVASLCPSCRTPHHEPCLRYIGHCAVFACSRTELSEQRRREAVAEKARAATG